jgi:outer-membrane receptor for ferric coprogen and ferric-rhodotorulic acid
MSPRSRRSFSPATTPRRGPALKPLAALVVAWCAAWPLAAHAQAPAAPLSFDLPAQPLERSLAQAARRAGLQLLMPAEGLRDLQAPALRGEHRFDDAMTELLRGTPWRARVEGGSVVIEPTSKGAGDGAVTLPSVSVQARRAASATTEGNGRYAAQAVTLGKGEVAWREIPQSVSVMTRQQIADQQFTSVAEVMNQMTGTRAEGYERQEVILIRGFNVNPQYDGVPQQGLFSHGDLALYDRIEVLRGPSGLLSGTGEPGGTVNYVRKRPRPAFAVEGALSAGSWNRWRTELDVTGPLTESRAVRGRVVAVLQDGDRHYDLGRNRDKILYGAVDVDLGENTVLGLGATATRRDYVVNWGLPLYGDGRLPGRGAFVGLDENSSEEGSHLVVDLTHRFANEWALRAAVQRRETKAAYLGGYGVSTIDVATGLGDLFAEYDDNRSTWNSLDLNLTGPFTFAGRRHELTLGYNRSRRDNPWGYAGQSLAGRALLTDHELAGALQREASSASETFTRQAGFYAATRLKLADPLTLSLGGRWTDYVSRSRNTYPTATAWAEGDDKVDNEFTPYLGLVWDVKPGVSLYASYADIFVPQTQKDYTGRMLEPRVGWQVEAGAKAELLDGRLNASVAVFRVRDSHRALLDPDHTNCTGGSCYRAAGEVQSQGWEAEAVGRLSPGWDVSAGYTYVRAEYRSDADPANVGQRFGSDATPVHLLRVWTQYRPASDGGAQARGWVVGAGAHVQSNMYTSAVRQGGYATVMAKLGYRLSPQLEATVVLNNLFDRTYLVTPGFDSFYNLYGDPRNVMVTLRGSF